MNITILGAGAYGLALSSMFEINNCNVTIWTKLENEKIESIDSEALIEDFSEVILKIYNKILEK